MAAPTAPPSLPGTRSPAAELASALPAPGVRAPAACLTSLPRPRQAAFPPAAPASGQAQSGLATHPQLLAANHGPTCAKDPARPAPPGVCEQPVSQNVSPAQHNTFSLPSHVPARSVAPSVCEQPASAPSLAPALPAHSPLPARPVIPSVCEQPASGLFSPSPSASVPHDCSSGHHGPIPAVRMFLDLFSGSSAPVCNAIRTLLLARFEPVDLLAGSALDISDDATYSTLCRLCASGLVGACCAAPPCSAFSRARLLKSGPPPVRTPSFPLGLPNLSPQQQRELHMSALLHQRTRHLLSLVAARGGLIFLENPASSLLWLDPRSHGLGSCICPFRRFCCLLYHRPLSAQRSADGMFLTRATACYPPSLASAIASLCVPFVSIEDREYTLSTWVALLPPRLPWPPYPFPVEDGAGMGSTACHTRPQSEDHFKALRHAWSARLLSSGLVPKIVTALSSGSKSAPLSEAELAPFFLDLREFLQVRQDDTWTALLSIDKGQPFRLSLWHALSLIFKDADAGLFPHLHAGVPLGFSDAIPPCPLLQASHASPPADAELCHCESAWKSALDNAEIVDKLLQEELDAGWICEITGGDDELKRLYKHSAVGKLGVVLSEGRPPRLVVDSSISGVTNATHLPNRSANPTLLDVRRCLPISDARERLVALVLDVSKAHRRIKILPADQGLLCFRHRGRLYQCKTLNFGARASGFYWARVAGLLVRLVHRFWWVSHSALIYVDDLLSILEKSSAPLLAALLVVLLQVLNVPMSWRKAKLSASVVWIGWQMDFRTFTVRLEPAKLQRLLSLLRQCYRSAKLPATTLEKLTGKRFGLLTFSGRFDHLWLPCARTNTALHLYMCPFLRRLGSACKRLFPMTSGLLRRQVLPLPPWGADYFGWLKPPCNPKRNCHSFLLPHAGYGSKSPILRTPIVSSRTLHVQSWRCGSSSAVPVLTSDLSCYLRTLIVRPLLTRVRAVLLQGWEGLFACPLAKLSSSRLSSHRRNSTPYFRGSLRITHLNTTLQPGNFLLSAPCCIFWPACCLLDIRLCMSHFAVTIPLRMPHPGRVSPLRQACAAYCVPSSFCRSGSTYPST